jgi:hypothetical protein
MNDIRDIQLHRLFAQEPLPAPDPALVEAVMADVERERRNARAVTGLVALCVLLVAAAVAPLAATYISHLFATLEVATIEVAMLGMAGMRGSYFPLVSTALMALAIVGAAAWAIRS